MNPVKLMLTAALLLAQLSRIPDVQACQCRGMTLQEAQQWSDFIVEATVSEVSRGRLEGPVKLSDVLVLKGAPLGAPTLEIINGDDCAAVPLTVGERYLIYLSQREPRLHTNVCGRTVLASSASTEIKGLLAARPPSAAATAKPALASATPAPATSAAPVTAPPTASPPASAPPPRTDPPPAGCAGCALPGAPPPATPAALLVLLAGGARRRRQRSR